MAKPASAARAPYDGPANLNGKVAVVTGGSQGLGEAIARLFAERGAAGLVICGRNARQRRARRRGDFRDRLPDLFRQRRPRQGRRLPRGDRRGRPPLRPRSTCSSTPPALTDRGNIFDTTEERYNEIFDVNVRAPFFLIQGAVTIMRREKIAGLDRQHPVDVGAWRPALHHRLLRLEGRARDADAQRRAFAAQVPHPRQRPQHRLDVDAGRGPHHEDLSRRQGRLAGGGGQDRARSAA